MTGRPWTEEDNAKLKSLAGTMRVEALAAEMCRSPGAVMVQASNLRLSLAYKKQRRASFHNPQSAPRF